MVTVVEVVIEVVVEVDVDFVVLVVVFVVFVVLVIFVEVVTDVFAEVDLELAVLVVDARWVEWVVVGWGCIPRTLGMVPIVAVSCARRVRVTSRILTKVRLLSHVDLQVMDSQAPQQISRTLCINFALT